MRHFALSAIGRDRPGIVAAVTETLLEHGLNIEDSEMTILRGHFTMTLIVSAPEKSKSELLRGDLERVRERLGLDAVSLNDVDEVQPDADSIPSHVVTVYGADHPGIVHAVSAVLAGREINITDLETRLVDQEEGQALYVLMMEIALPDAVSPSELEELLEQVGREQAVEVSVNPLEQDQL